MKSKILAFLQRFARAFWASLSHNLGLKLLSLLLAVLLWSYVVTSNPSITRSKDINGLTAYLSNESVLNANRLALASDPAEALENVSVRLEVPQASYALADAENVQVSVDLSSVRAAGTQEVALRATTAYGRVVSILPETVTLEFEAYDSRSVPLNASITGGDDGRHVVQRQPPQPTRKLVISGPSSVVRTIASAYVYVDVTGREASYITAARFTLVDYSGEEIPQTLLSSSSSSVTGGRGRLPHAGVARLRRHWRRGAGRAGRRLRGDLRHHPAGESSPWRRTRNCWPGLSELLIQPVDVSGASQTFSQRARISSLTDFKNISTEQVYVTVNIEEVQPERLGGGGPHLRQHAGRA